MYYSLTNYLFWLYGLLSFVAVVVSCYLPGVLILQKAKMGSALTRFLGAWAVGIALLSGQGFVFGYLHARWLSYCFLGIILILGFVKRSQVFDFTKAALIEIFQFPKSVLIAAVLSSFFQVFGHIGSGILREKGIGYYFVNSADGMLHLGYIQGMINRFPPIEPGLAGSLLVNYHYWGDLFFAELARIWQLPVNHLFFQYLPPVLFILITLGFVQLIKQFSNKTVSLLIGLFLLTFGADASFIFSLYFKRTWGDSVPALDTGVSFIFNMPQVFGRYLLISNLLLLQQWLKNRQSYLLFVIAAVGSTMVGFKIYYGIYFLIGFGFLSLYIFLQRLLSKLKHKKIVPALSATIIQERALFAAWIVLLVLVACIFFSANSTAGGLLYVPLAWAKVFLSPEHYDWRDWWLRMQVYEESHNLRNLAIFNTIAVIITLISVYGVRLLGLVPNKNLFRKLPAALLLFFLPTNFLFIFVGMTYFQISGGLNIYNFLITPILSIILMSAISIGEIKNRIYQITLIALVVIFSIPKPYILLKQYYSEYYSQRPTELVSRDELELLKFIKENTPPDAVVQADSKNKYDQLTPYVSFFSTRATYLGGQNLLATHNLDVTDRRKTVITLFEQNDLSKLPEQMKLYDIDYLYVTDPGLLDKFLATENDTKNELTLLKQNKAGLVFGVWR